MYNSQYSKNCMLYAAILVIDKRRERRHFMQLIERFSTKMTRIGKYSMCAHSGALKRFFGISAEHTIRILIVVYAITFLINLLYFWIQFRFILQYLIINLSFFVPLGNGPQCMNHVPKMGPCCSYTGIPKNKHKINILGQKFLYYLMKYIFKRLFSCQIYLKSWK